MATVEPPEPDGGAPGVVRLCHGTDLASANDIANHGLDQQQAAACNGSGEFWATTDPDAADWFAQANPNSPPAARLEFDLPDGVLQALLGSLPPAAYQHGADNYEFLPASFPALNQSRNNVQVIPLP
jgi:hypothetical protein